MGEPQQVVLRFPALPGLLVERLPRPLRCALELVSTAAAAHWRRRWTLRPDHGPRRGVHRCAAALEALADRDRGEVAFAAEVVERLGAAGGLDAVDLDDAAAVLAAVERVAFGRLAQFHDVARSASGRRARARAAGVARAREALAAAGTDLSRVVAVEPLDAAGAYS